MAVEILMPALSPTMTEGTLARWLKNTGDAVRSGEVIAEIETDKATMEVEAVDEGRLARILVPAGTHGVAVNTPIAVILEEGEGEAALAEPTPKPSAATDTGRLFASPLARRLAAEAGLDLASIRGSGPHGRVVRADIEAARAAPKPARAPLATAVPVPSPAPAPSNASPVLRVPPSAPAAKADGFDTRDWADRLGLVYRTEPLTTMRKVIARRLSESKQTVPHFYLSADCRIDSLLKMRAELNARSDAYKLSVNDFVIRAAALALKKVPAANAAYADDAILLFDSADISVAVATPAGLITPIVKKAETKGLAAISAEMKNLAARARDGKLKPEEFQGGTFSISNLGMFGVRDFAAIINPPQACILAVGAAEPRPIVIDGALAVGTVMTCTLSVDHRVVDGAVGAGFMAAFKTLIEDPLSMLL